VANDGLKGLCWGRVYRFEGELRGKVFVSYGDDASYRKLLVDHRRECSKHAPPTHYQLIAASKLIVFAERVSASRDGWDSQSSYVEGLSSVRSTTGMPVDSSLSLTVRNSGRFGKLSPLQSPPVGRQIGESNVKFGGMMEFLKSATVPIATLDGEDDLTVRMSDIRTEYQRLYMTKV